jgi:hypothetical protein
MKGFVRIVRFARNPTSHFAEGLFGHVNVTVCYEGYVCLDENGAPRSTLMACSKRALTPISPVCPIGIG